MKSTNKEKFATVVFIFSFFAMFFITYAASAQDSQGNFCPVLGVVQGHSLVYPTDTQNYYEFSIADKNTGEKKSSYRIKKGLTKSTFTAQSGNRTVVDAFVGTLLCKAPGSNEWIEYGHAVVIPHSINRHYFQIGKEVERADIYIAMIDGAAYRLQQTPIIK